MRRAVITAERLDEQLVCDNLDNGLQVYVMKRQGYQQVFGSIGVRCGHVSQALLPLADGRMVRTPLGIQHFLEHMMFKHPSGGDVYNLFAERDATITAFTTQQMTTFTFSCMDQVAENIRGLLDMVATPHFPRELVEAEHKVIQKEIRLFERDEENSALLRVLAGLYGDIDPLATDILGTCDSIAPIDSELLSGVYDRFYQPSEMILLLVGDIDEAEVFATVQEHELAKKEIVKKKVDLLTPPALATGKHSQWVVQESEEGEMAIVLLGLREDLQGMTPAEQLRTELISQVALQALVGPRTKLDRQLNEAGVMTGELGWMTDFAASYAYACLGGTTFDAELTRELLTQRITELATHGIAEEEFERARIKLLSQYMQGFDEVTELTPRVIHNLIRGVDFFATEEVLRCMACEDVNRSYRKWKTSLK